MKSSKTYLRRAAGVLLAAMLVAGTASAASAGTYTGISVTPLNPTAGADATTWTVAVAGGGTGSAAVQCLQVTIDNVGALTTTSLPGGFAITNPGGSLITAPGSWSAPTNPASSNKVQWTNTNATFASSGNLTFTVDNPNAADEYFVRVEIFTNSNCSTGRIDVGDTSVVITSNVVVSVAVDPTLAFTVDNRATACNGESNYVNNSANADTALNLGRIVAGVPASSGQDLTVASNAGGGYAVFVRGENGANNMRNASHQFQDVAGSNGSPAAFGSGERFGYTALGENVTFASNTFAALTGTPAPLLQGGANNSGGSGCVSYQVQADTTTPAGAYSATIIYSAVPTY